MHWNIKHHPETQDTIKKMETRDLGKLEKQDPEQEKLEYLRSIKNNIQFISWLIIISLSIFFLYIII